MPPIFGSVSGPQMFTKDLTAEQKKMLDQQFELADKDKDGKLDAKEGYTFFLKSQLPQETLGKIWNVADAQRRGYLDREGFYAAMQMVAAAKSGSAIGAAKSTFSLAVLTREAKAKYDKYFEQQDKDRDGWLTAGEAWQFLSQSNQPKDTLKKICVLADIHKEGRFSKEEFSIAMHLCQACVRGTPVPTKIPQSLLDTAAGKAPAVAEPKPLDPGLSSADQAAANELRADTGFVDEKRAMWQGELDDTIAEKKGMQGQMEELRNENAAKTKLVESLEQQVSIETAAIVQLREDVDRAADQKEEFEAKIRGLETALERAKVEKLELEKVVAEARAVEDRLAGAKAKLNAENVTYEGISSELAARKQQLTDAQSSLKDTERRTDRMRNDVKEMKVTIEKTERTIAAAKNDKGSLERELEQLAVEFKDAQNAKIDLEAHNARALESYQQLLEQVNTEKMHIEEEHMIMTKTKIAIADLETRSKAKRDQQGKLEVLYSKLQRQIKQLKVDEAMQVRFVNRLTEATEMQRRSCWELQNDIPELEAMVERAQESKRTSEKELMHFKERRKEKDGVVTSLKENTLVLDRECMTLQQTCERQMDVIAEQKRWIANNREELDKLTKECADARAKSEELLTEENTLDEAISEQTAQKSSTGATLEELKKGIRDQRKSMDTRSQEKLKMVADTTAQSQAIDMHRAQLDRLVKQNGVDEFDLGELELITGGKAAPAAEPAAAQAPAPAATEDSSPFATPAADTSPFSDAADTSPFSSAPAEASSPFNGAAEADDSQFAAADSSPFDSAPAEVSSPFNEPAADSPFNEPAADSPFNEPAADDSPFGQAPDASPFDSSAAGASPFDSAPVEASPFEDPPDDPFATPAQSEDPFAESKNGDALEPTVSVTGSEGAISGNQVTDTHDQHEDAPGAASPFADANDAPAFGGQAADPFSSAQEPAFEDAAPTQAGPLAPAAADPFADAAPGEVAGSAQADPFADASAAPADPFADAAPAQGPFADAAPAAASAVADDPFADAAPAQADPFASAGPAQDAPAAQADPFADASAPASGGFGDDAFGATAPAAGGEDPFASGGGDDEFGGGGGGFGGDAFRASAGVDAGFGGDAGSSPPPAAAADPFAAASSFGDGAADPFGGDGGRGAAAAAEPAATEAAPAAAPAPAEAPVEVIAFDVGDGFAEADAKATEPTNLTVIIDKIRMKEEHATLDAEPHFRLTVCNADGKPVIPPIKVPLKLAKIKGYKDAYRAATSFSLPIAILQGVTQGQKINCVLEMCHYKKKKVSTKLWAFFAVTPAMLEGPVQGQKMALMSKHKKTGTAVYKEPQSYKSPKTLLGDGLFAICNIAPE